MALLIPHLALRRRSIGLFWPRLHVHVWWFKRGPATGCHVKVHRHDGLWRHLRLRLAEPPARPIEHIGVLTWELDSWLTKKCRSSKDTRVNRIGVKSFIRFKVGLGSANAVNPDTVRKRLSKERREQRARLAATTSTT